MDLLNKIIQMDRRHGTVRIIFAIALFLILLSLTNHYTEILIPFIFFADIISICLIFSKVPDKRPGLYCGALGFCVFCMVLIVWSMSVVTMEQYILDKNIDDGIIFINFNLLSSVAILFFWFYKCKDIYCGIFAKLTWNSLHVVNLVLILFAFGMLNLVYSVPISDKMLLVNKMEADSTLLYVGRFVYTGAIPALYGKDVISKSVDASDEKYLTTVYDLGMSFSYDELIVLNEFIFVAGYLYMGYTLKPFK